jgi:glycosyltransferase involved in cell wall biosynthesis
VRVLLVEPYFGGSHRQWAEGYAASSAHEVHLVTHDAGFWKWRMEGGHVTLAAQAAAVVAEHGSPDVVLASDMLNLPAFLGAGRHFLGNPGVALYMHENQLTYPASHLSQEDLTHAMINWSSVAAADGVFFNSPFHLEDFFGALPELLGRFPDHRHSALVAGARDRSSVLPVGIDLRRLDAVAPQRSSPPLVLWNQRWEHDKNPEEFFGAVDALVDDGLDFRLALAGETFSTIPGAFEEARDRLGPRVVHFGYARQPDYDRLLRSADIVVSTSHHEFFGVAIVEAIYAGAWPVLPNRLAYPGHVPVDYHDVVLYDAGGLVDRLRSLLQRRPARSLSEAVAHYDWSAVAPRYDAALTALAGPSG